MNLIFDIGYNKGVFTQECIKKYPNCKVIGVEANPHLITGNLPQNVVLLNNLVSNVSEEKIDFFIEHNQTGISTASKKYLLESRFAKGSPNLPPNSGMWSPPIKINSITLDNMVKTFGIPDLIKVDVEGYEYEVISGLTQKCNKICFEWHEEDLETLKKSVVHLQNIGFKEFGIIGYFYDGDIHKGVTYDHRADPHLVEPAQYHSWEFLENIVDRMCKPERRVTYGMMYAR